MFLTDEGKPLPDGAITNLLKKIKVKGIIQDKQTGAFLDYFTSAYDMRRYNSTIAYKARFPLETMARMKGRAITSIAGAGSEGVYPSPMTGLYDTVDLEPHERLSTIIHDQLNKKLNITDQNTISSDQDLVENYTKSTATNNLLQVTDKAEGQAYSTTSELTDKDFKAPVLPEGQTIEGEFKDVTGEKKETYTSVSKEHFSQEELDALKNIGIDEDDIKPTGSKKLKSIDPFSIVAGGAGVAGVLDDTGELVGEEIAQSTIAQTTSKIAPKLAQTTLGKALPVAGAGLVFPSFLLTFQRIVVLRWHR